MAELDRRPVDDDVHRVGVVGDRHEAAGHDRRGRARSGIDLTGLDDPRVPVGDLPVDVRLALARAEAVHPLVGRDVDPAPPHRERVLDLLAGAEDRDLPRLRIEDPHLPILLGHEPDAALEVGQRRRDALIGAQYPGQVIVADLVQRHPVGALGEDEDVPRLCGAPNPVLLVEEEVTAAGEVLVCLGARRIRRVRHVVGGEDLERVRVDDPGLGRGCRQGRAHRDDPAMTVEGQRATDRRHVCGVECHELVTERSAAAVGVGHPGVVVDVVVGIPGEEGVLGRDRGRCRVGGGRGAGERGGDARRAGRDRRRGRRRAGSEHGERRDGEGKAFPSGHGPSVPAARSSPAA